MVAAVVMGSLRRLEDSVLDVVAGEEAVGNPREGEVYLGSTVAAGRAGGSPATDSLKQQEWCLPITATIIQLKLHSFTQTHALTWQWSVWSTGCSGIGQLEEQVPDSLFLTEQCFLQQPQKQNPGHQTAHSAQTHQPSLAFQLLKKESVNPDNYWFTQSFFLFLN